MDRIQKFIFISGLALIILGFLSGLAFSYANKHQARLVTNDSYEAVFELLSKNNTEVNWRELQKQINSNNITNARITDVHTHSINMGIVILLLGLLSPLLNITQRSTKIILTGVVSAAWIYPLGLFFQLFQFKFLGEFIAALGACLIIILFMVMYAQISRALLRID